MQGVISLVFFLILSTLVLESECCLKMLMPDDNSTLDDSKNFRKVRLTDPLYLGNSVDEFLKLCKESNNITLIPEKDMEDKTKRFEDTNCSHPAADPPRMMKKLELFYLQEAQSKLKTQKERFGNQVPKLISFLLFLIPLAMTIYLVIKGQFYIGHLPALPFWDRMFKPQKDKTEGIKYNLFIWMKFLSLPGNHPVVRQRDPKKVTWYKYNKKDEVLDPKKVSVKRGSTKFKFRDRRDIDSVTEEELRQKKKNMTKVGWDFVADRKSYDARRSTFHTARHSLDDHAASANIKSKLDLRRKSDAGKVPAVRMELGLSKGDNKKMSLNKAEIYRKLSGMDAFNAAQNQKQSLSTPGADARKSSPGPLREGTHIEKSHHRIDHHPHQTHHADADAENTERKKSV